MLAHMVDLEGERDLTTLRARIRLVDEHLSAEPGPPRDPVPAAYRGIRPDSVARTGSAGDEDGAAGLGAVLHLTLSPPAG